MGSAKIPAQSNFDKDKYEGKWFEIYRSNNCTHGETNTIDYFRDERGAYRALHSAQEYVDRKKGPTEHGPLENTRVFGVCSVRQKRQAALDNKANLGFKFDSTQLFEGNMNVIETDYDKFSVVYTKVKNLIGPKKEMVYVLSREPYDSSHPQRQQIYQKAKEAMNQHIPDYDFDKNITSVRQGSDVQNANYGLMCAFPRYTDSKWACDSHSHLEFLE